jgi:hypothetical protein
VSDVSSVNSSDLSSSESESTTAKANTPKRKKRATKAVKKKGKQQAVKKDGLQPNSTAKVKTIGATAVAVPTGAKVELTEAKVGLEGPVVVAGSAGRSKRTRKKKRPYGADEVDGEESEGEAEKAVEKARQRKQAKNAASVASSVPSATDIDTAPPMAASAPASKKAEVAPEQRQEEGEADAASASPAVAAAVDDALLVDTFVTKGWVSVKLATCSCTLLSADPQLASWHSVCTHLSGVRCTPAHRIAGLSAVASGECEAGSIGGCGVRG